MHRRRKQIACWGLTNYKKVSTWSQIFTLVKFFPIKCTTYLGHSIYHEFTWYLITSILAYGYEYKEIRFIMFEPKHVFYLKSLFEAFKDQIIFILHDNWSFDTTYSCTIFLGYITKKTRLLLYSEVTRWKKQVLHPCFINHNYCTRNMLIFKGWVSIRTFFGPSKCGMTIWYIVK